LSGGISAFRHRRGQLERLAVTIEASALSRWAKPRIERVIGAPLLHHLVAAGDDGWTVGVASETGALAFDLLLAPLEGDLRLIPMESRGLGLSEAPHQLALRLVAAVLRPLGEMVGGALVVAEAARAVARELLPPAGMRLPATQGLVLSEMRVEVGMIGLEAAREATPRPLGERAIRAVETAVLAAEADGALFAGAAEDARRGYLEALGRAPRHPELARRLAELDRATGERDAAALATLSDAMAPMEAGALGGALLLAQGDAEGARVALRRAGDHEPYGPLAARCLAELAANESLPERCALLDRAVARAPMVADLRWARFEARLAAGRATDAAEDAEHLEAAAAGAHARHEVLRRAGDCLLERRYLDEAVRAYERSLRYLPDSVEAVAGLARALSRVGRRSRALELLSRAVGLAQRRGRPDDALAIELATALVEIADDRPAAIAHLRGVRADSSQIFAARGLEARWCAEIGDLTGASGALARLAEAVEQNLGALLGEADPRAVGAREEARAAVAAHLLAGARIHELDRSDLPAAQRLLALAIRLAPRHHGVREAFRRVAAAMPARSVPTAEPTRPFRAALPVERPTQVPMPLAAEPVRARETDPGLGPDATVELELEGDEADDELLAESLAERLRANPGDEAIASELARLLERLGRDHELLALVSGRIDDLGPTETLLARRRAVLARLEDRARREGREEEAALYALMRDR
jgi:cellulose synthase operon protein C